MNRFNRYQKKLLLLIGSIFILIIAAIIMVNRAIDIILYAKISDNIINVGQGLVRNIASAISIDDEYALNMFIHDICMNENIYYSSITDYKGENIVEKDVTDENNISKMDIEYMKIPLEVLDAKYGNLIIGYYIKDELKKISMIKILISISGLAITFIIMIYIIFFPNSLLAPIIKLTDTHKAGMETRKYYRVPVELDAGIKDRAEDVFQGKIINISMGGVCLRSEKKLSLDSKFSLNFEWASNKFDITGMVVHIKETDNVYEYGVSFLNVNLWERNKLAELLNKR